MVRVIMTMIAEAEMVLSIAMFINKHNDHMRVSSISPESWHEILIFPIGKKHHKIHQQSECKNE
jgi:hypothetical protein